MKRNRNFSNHCVSPMASTPSKDQTVPYRERFQRRPNFISESTVCVYGMRVFFKVGQATSKKRESYRNAEASSNSTNFEYF